MNEIDLRKYIGTKIRQYRKEKKITQEELGKKIGVKNNTISAYERGTISLDTDTIYKLSEILDVDPNDLLPPVNDERAKVMSRIQSLLTSNLNAKDVLFLQNLIEKTLSLEGEERERFLESIKFTVDYHNEMNKKD